MKLLLSILIISLCIVGIVAPFTLRLMPVWFAYTVSFGCFIVMLCTVYAIVTLVE